MRITIEGPPGPDEPRRPLIRRLGWLLLIAACAVIATGGVAYGLKALLPAA